MHPLCISLTLLSLVSLGWASDIGGNNCPASCTCTETVAQCSGGAIPTALPHTIDSLLLRNTNPSIFKLSSNATMKITHLVELEMVSVGLSTLEPGALGKIKYLTTLTIMNNHISSLAKPVFNNCNVLNNVTLDNNKIMVVEEDTFSELVTLQYLSLKHNVLFELPAQLPKSLYSLNAEYNPMSDVPKMVLPNLKELNLCNNHFYSIEAKKIQLDNLEELCIGGPGFQMNGKFINSKKLPRLKKLEVHGTNEGELEIKGRAMKAIADMAERQLETLYMENCTMYPYQGSKLSLLVNLLQNRNSKLNDIRLIGINPSEPINPGTPTTRIAIDIPSLAVMDISGSPFLAQALLNLPANSQLSGLQKLLMANCQVYKFPPYMQERFPSLRHLDLSNNPLYCDYEGFSWIYKNSVAGKLVLLEPQDTQCATPDQLAGMPLMDAMKHLVTTTTSTTTTTTPKPTTSTTSEPATTTSITSPTPEDTTPTTTTSEPTTTPEPTTTEQQTVPIVVTVPASTKLYSTMSSTTTPAPSETFSTEFEPEINSKEMNDSSPTIPEVMTEQKISSTTEPVISSTSEVKLSTSIDATTNKSINTILENSPENSTLSIHTSESLSADRMLNDQSTLTVIERPSGMSNLTLYLIIVAVSLAVMVFLAVLTLRIYHRCHSDSFIVNGDDNLLASHENGNCETAVIMNRMPLKSNGHIE